MEEARGSGGEANVLALPGPEDELLEILAHELRSPLNAARWTAEVVRASADELGTDELRRAMDSLLRSVRHLGSLLESMLAEADAASDMRLHRHPVEVDHLVKESVEDLSGVLGGRLVAVTVEGPAVAWADPDRLRQAVTALLVNAARYSPPGTPISVRVIRRPHLVEVAVADHCAGIPGEARERIFERHTRLDHPAEGRGLGLFTARRLARAHGGDLRVSSSPSWGCRFLITLPRTPVRTLA